MCVFKALHMQSSCRCPVKLMDDWRSPPPPFFMMPSSSVVCSSAWEGKRKREHQTAGCPAQLCQFNLLYSAWLHIWPAPVFLPDRTGTTHPPPQQTPDLQDSLTLKLSNEHSQIQIYTKTEECYCTLTVAFSCKLKQLYTRC